MDGHLRKLVTLRAGVPQGGEIAFFLPYITEIIQFCHQHVFKSLHVDDFVDRTTTECTTTASYLLQKTVDKVENWTQNLGIKLNQAKTTATIHSRSPNKENVSSSDKINLYLKQIHRLFSRSSLILKWKQ